MRVRLLILLVIAAIAAPALGAQGPAQASDAAPPPKGDAENGKKIYTSYGCYQCHNPAAHGGGAGPRLAPRPLPFAAFVKYVREPTNQMPPYTAKVVTDQDLADIYSFLLTIPAPPAAESIPILR
jgi:mono/diheme cytochrome c family protein